MDIKTEYESIELDDAVKKEEFFEKLEDDGHWCDGETGLSNQSKKISKRRKKYQKIDNEIRLKIIEEVQKNGKLLKNAAEKYNVNYSSAKSIFHVYRKEGRVLKKPFKGRASKTIFHLTNPVVFMNLPNQNTSSSLNTTSNGEKGFYSPIYREIPSVKPLTIDSDTSKENSPTNLVSVLHPSSAFMLQSFCNQNISISHKTNLSCNQSVVEHEIRKNIIAEKRRDHFIKPIHDSVQKIYNYPSQTYNFQNYQHFNTGFLPGLPMPSPVSESMKKAYLINQWVKNQWKAV